MTGDEDLPEELARLLDQLGGPGLAQQLRLASQWTGGPVQWDLARQVAIQVAAEGDRLPTPDERERAEDAHRLAEHLLDEGGLPSPPDAGQLAVVSRQEWVIAALDGMRPLVEPVAAASTRALADLAGGQLAGALAAEIDGADLGALAKLVEPMGATLMGLQTGQVIGQLARQMLGQHDLGVPTATPERSFSVAVNVEAAFAGYGLDPTEVAVVLALDEGAHRRQFHAVPWLAGHIHGLVAAFAAGTHVDADELLGITHEVMRDVDPDDPASLQSAIERASTFRLEPTADQRRVLERLQGVVLLLQAWARREVRVAAESRLPNVARVEEVLRRRRSSPLDGERLLASLLGLDLTPADETVGDRFIEEVVAARGLDGLRRALGHPENLPDADELADASRWLVRMASGESIPDDPSALFGLGDAPVEPPGDARRPGDTSDTAD